MKKRGRRSLAVVLAVAVAAVAPPMVAEAQLVRVGSPEVAFLATGPGGLKIAGTTGDLDVADDGKLVVVKVATATLTTGIALRDRHLREKTLDVQAFPRAELRVERTALHIPDPGKESAQDAQGKLQLHGFTKPVPFHYVAKHDGKLMHVSGTARIDIRDFGMEIPSYLGVTVKPLVDVTARFDVADR